MQLIIMKMNKDKLIKGLFFLAISFSFMCTGAIMLTVSSNDYVLFSIISLICIIIVFIFGFLGLKHILDALFNE